MLVEIKDQHYYFLHTPKSGGAALQLAILKIWLEHKKEEIIPPTMDPRGWHHYPDFTTPEILWEWKGEKWEPPETEQEVNVLSLSKEWTRFRFIHYLPNEKDILLMNVHPTIDDKFIPDQISKYLKPQHICKMCVIRNPVDFLFGYVPDLINYTSYNLVIPDNPEIKRPSRHFFMKEYFESLNFTDKQKILFFVNSTTEMRKDLLKILENNQYIHIFYKEKMIEWCNTNKSLYEIILKPIVDYCDIVINFETFKEDFYNYFNGEGNPVFAEKLKDNLIVFNYSPQKYECDDETIKIINDHCGDFWEETKLKFWTNS